MAAIRFIVTHISAWLMRARTRRHLLRLDPRLLADIGVAQAERNRECAKWCWQGRETAITDPLVIDPAARQRGARSPARSALQGRS